MLDLESLQTLLWRSVSPLGSFTITVFESNLTISTTAIQTITLINT